MKGVLRLHETIELTTVEELKYPLSNAEFQTSSNKELAWFQAQRYWVEQDFRNGTSELGISDYPVRKWRGWHHHHAIVFMAMLFMLKERIEHEERTPLMSIRDARIRETTLIAQTLLQTEPEMNRQLRLMEKRHQKRKKDQQRYYLDG